MRLEGFTSHQEAMAEAIAWVSEIIPYQYPEFEYHVMPVTPN